MQIKTKSKSDLNVKGHIEQTNTCSKPTIETLEQGGKYNQS